MTQSPTRTEAACHEASLADLIAQHAFFDANWTPENDGETLGLSRTIRARLMDDLHLSQDEVEALGRAL